MRTAWLLLFCFIAFSGFSGQPAYAQKKSAGQHLHSLKNGVLLVRLTTRKNTLERLRSQGHKQEAANIEKAQRRKNKEIIRAFQQEYNFSEVLFFYNHQTEAVQQGRLDEVTFLNANLEPDTSLKLNGRPFLVAEFGTMRRKEYQKTDNKSGEEITYSDASALEIGALVMRTEQFELLDDPFPRVRSFDSFESRPASKTVKKLNKKLHALYDRNRKLMEQFDKHGYQPAETAAQP